MKKTRPQTHSVTTLTKYLTRGGAFFKRNIFTEKNKSIIYVFLLIALAGDIFFSPGDSDFHFFGLTGLALITNLFYRLKSKYVFILCLILLCIMYVFFLTQGTSGATEKVAIWIVLFMVVGIAQQWFENEQK
jgi:hypothetical protein